jgi:hypothetical protein
VTSLRPSPSGLTPCDSANSTLDKHPHRPRIDLSLRTPLPRRLLTAKPALPLPVVFPSALNAALLLLEELTCTALALPPVPAHKGNPLLPLLDEDDNSIPGIDGRTVRHDAGFPRGTHGLESECVGVQDVISLALAELAGSLRGGCDPPRSRGPDAVGDGFVQEWPRDVVPACEDELVAEQRYVDVRVRGHDVGTVGQEGLGSARGPRAGLLDWCCAVPAQYGGECVGGRHGLGLDGGHGVCVSCRMLVVRL